MDDLTTKLAEALRKVDGCEDFFEVQAIAREALRLYEQAKAQPAECDGGTCGLGGYCDACPKAQPVQDERAAFEAWVSEQIGGDGDDTLYSAYSWLGWKARAVMAATPAAAREDGMPASADERHLRRLLAARVGMPHTYFDDGEAVGEQHGICIDFMREPVADIGAKLRALNVARYEVAKAATPAPAPCVDPFCACRGGPCAECPEGQAIAATPAPAEPVAYVDRMSLMWLSDEVRTPVASVATDLYKTAPGDGWVGIYTVPQAATPAPADWTTPATYRERFACAVALLCRKPAPDELIDGWLNRVIEDNRLQDFAVENAPAWAQGIVLLDAAHVLADTPTEGVDHGAATPAPAPDDLRRAAERAKDLMVAHICYQTTTRDQWKLVVHLLNKALGEEHGIGQGKEASK